MTATYPTGTVTFLFTDIESSTQLWERHPEAMKAALARHDAVLREAIETHNGRLIKTTGDGIHAVFETAADSVLAVVAGQQALLAAAWDVTGPLKVRMALHTGEAEVRAGDYYGQASNRAARIMAAGHGGQILLSGVTAEIVREHLPQDIRLQDLGEHHLKDLLRPERLYQLVAPDLPADFPPLKSLNASPNNLPVQLTSFIGREREMGEVNQLLASTRLLTLIGPGGTGKTRLSLQIAAEQLSEFKDGVWLIELAPLADPELILQTTASVFNLRAQMGMPLRDIITDYLRAKNLLLLLDNCEHLVEACARFVDQLLRLGPQIKIIASSREALGINGETVYRVPSLSLPDQSNVALAALTGCESIQLFVDRARAASPKFNLTERNAAAVAQICRRLEGIPLALELAAARINVFAPEQIAARLDDRFRLLTGGSRAALPRQQTLRALIDWSYDILPEEERALLRRLSVFAGGWTLEAAEAIGPHLDVLNLLAQLVNKSLVTVDEGLETRYRLLETIRQYARDRLLDEGEAAPVRHLHLEYFVAFASRAAPRIDTREALEWLLRLDAEYDNFRAAFEWGLDHNMEACLRLVGDLAYFWFRRGHGAEGIQMANAAFAHAEALPKPEDGEAARQHMRVRAKALQAMSFLCYSQGDNSSAFKVGDECLGLARQLGDQRMLAIALAFSGSAILFDGNSAEAQARIEEAIALTRATGEKFGLGIALGMMAQVAMIKEHDLQAAQAYEQEALTLTADSGNSWTRLMLFFGTGRGAMFRRDYATARERFARCLPLFEEMKDEHRVNMIHSEYAHMDRYEGQYQRAEAAYRRTIMVWQKLGHRAAVAHQVEAFAFIALAQGQPERAARLLGAAEILREKINIQMNPPERMEYAREVAQVRAGLDGKVFASLWSEGRALTMEQAVELAVMERS